MDKFEYLEVYDLVLTTASPLFVGDGNVILKKCYIFKRGSGTASILDENKFFELMVRRNLVDAYENFLLGKGGRESGELYRFLTDTCRLKESDWQNAIRYKIDASNLIDSRKSLRDINTFIRDKYGRIYIPGSSIKGAIDTVLLCKYILNDPKKSEVPFDQKKFNDNLFTRYFNKLNFDQRRTENAVNSLMRGIQISDSQPVSDDNLMVSLKMDAGVSGTFSNMSGELCRECIKPGTQIHFKLTLDQSVLKGRITKEDILDAIKIFNDYYSREFISRFNFPEDYARDEVIYGDKLILGGGSGFFSKTLIYQLLGKEKAIEFLSEYFQKSFKNNHHEVDKFLDISPHTLEYTKYNDKYYPMGLCEVEIS